MDREGFTAWLAGYVAAWESGDPQAIGNLFTEDARYYTGPFDPPIEGQEAIIEAWVEDPDPPGSFSCHYEPWAVEGETAVAHGWTRYLTEDRSEVGKEYSNIFLGRFAADGRCLEFREWYMLHRHAASE